MGEIHDQPIRSVDFPQPSAQKGDIKGKEAVDIRLVALASVKTAPTHPNVAMPAAAGKYPVLQETAQNIKKGEPAKRTPSDNEISAAVTRSAGLLDSEKMIGKGRKALLENMKTYPHQIARDITRLSSIEVAGHEISRTDRKTGHPRTAGDMYALTAINIMGLVKARNPAHADNAKKAMNELLHASTQHMTLTTAIGLSLALGPDWIAEANTSKLTVSYNMEPNGNVLEITQRGVKEVVNTEDHTAPSKHCTYEVTAKYDLASNDVSYICRYSIDGKSKEWQSPDPFRPEP